MSIYIYWHLKQNLMRKIRHKSCIRQLIEPIIGFNVFHISIMIEKKSRDHTILVIIIKLENIDFRYRYLTYIDE